MTSLRESLDSIPHIGEVYNNTESNYILITEDKLEIILRSFLDTYKKTKDWTTPLAIFITILIALATSSFKAKFLLISGAGWCTIFSIALLVSLIWLILSLNKLVKYKNHTKVDELIRTIKNVQNNQQIVN